MKYKKILVLISLSVSLLIFANSSQAQSNEVRINDPSFDLYARIYNSYFPEIKPSAYLSAKLEPVSRDTGGLKKNVRVKFTIIPYSFYLYAEAKWCDSMGGIHIATSNMCLMCIAEDLKLETTFSGKDGYFIEANSLYINNVFQNRPTQNSQTFIVRIGPFTIKDCNNAYVFRVSLRIQKPLSGIEGELFPQLNPKIE